MTPTIEFIFDFASPNAYFAYRALPPIVASQPVPETEGTETTEKQNA